jgi:predicted nuclease with TOPRIM domain
MISMMNSYQLPQRARSKPRKLTKAGRSGGGTEGRLAFLEMGFYEIRDRLSKIETRVDRLESKVDKLESKVDKLEFKVDNLASRMDTFVTKEELHRELHGLTWRIMGGATVLVSGVYYIARYVH